MARIFLLSFGSVSLSVQEKKPKIDFQDGRHLGFPTGTVLASFDLRVAPTHPSKFRVCKPISSRDGAQNIFSNGGYGGNFIFPIGTLLAIFCSASHPDASYQVSSQLAEGCSRSRLSKQIVDDARWTLTDHKSLHWTLYAQVAKTQMYKGCYKRTAHCIIAGYRRATWNKLMHTVALFNT